MNDLISREALYEKTCEWEAQALHMCEVTMNDEDNTEWKRWSAILNERTAFKFDIADAPTIDAVEVVRCKDCKWGEEKFGNIECDVDRNVPPEYHGYDWFCPNGERRDG